MALAKEMMGGGISAGTAQAIGGQALTLAATGSTVADAALVKASNVIVSGGDGSVGVVLPAGQVGDEIWMFNNSGSTLKVYPNTGAGITVTGTGLGTADAVYSHLTYKTVVYKMQSATQWFCVVT